MCKSLILQNQTKNNLFEKVIASRTLLKVFFTAVSTDYRDYLSKRYIKVFFILVFCMAMMPAPVIGNNSADTTTVVNDTLLTHEINFIPESASQYISRIIEMEQLWRNSDDQLKNSLSKLISNAEIPFDTIRKRLMEFDFTTIDYDTTHIITTDTLPLLWLNKSLFIVDTTTLDRSPYYIQKTIILKAFEPDSISSFLMDSIPTIRRIMDSLIGTKDTITENIIDFPYLKSKRIQIHQIENSGISPPLLPHSSPKTIRFVQDSSQIILSESKRVLISGSATPFYLLPGGNMPDSLEQAVATLFSYIMERDSVQVHLSDLKGKQTPFWLSRRKSDLFRYWLRNSKGDSITVWLGNPTKFELSMALEESVHVGRMAIMPADELPFIKTLASKTLVAINHLKEIPIPWDLGFSGSLSLNQNYITYWAQGGESSFAGLLDLSGSAKYSNKDNKSKWINSGRLRYGNVWTKDKGARVNTDIIEINSQFNKIIADKLDFSSVFYFKTQVSKGYNYPNDSVAVSKFLNPGTFTIGIGGEFSPVENTLLNFSPLSYKNTFVLDTGSIDQTIHGIEKGEKYKQEIGGQMLIKNNFKLLDEIKVASTLRLFSSYTDNPQNVDIDWEMIVERRISWIFSVKLNIHLIYDDDIRFPITTPEGLEVKAPRTQFNQFLGVSISLNL